MKLLKKPFQTPKVFQSFQLFLSKVWEKLKSVHLPEKGKKPETHSAGKAQSLSKRVMGIVIAGVLCTAICITLFTSAMMSASARNVASQAANASYDVIKAQLDSISTTLETDAKVITLDSNVLSALERGSSSGAVLAFSAISQTLGLDSATLFDAIGKVRTSTYDTNLGKNISSQACVKSVLGNESAMTVEKTNEFSYAINVAVPIYEQDFLLGGVMVSYDVSGTDFLDQFKKQSGNDFTIYLNDTSISTTMIGKDSKRLIGTKLDPKIADAVLHQGKTYTENTKINGTRYIATYSPIASSDGTITGVLFSGYNMSAYYSGLYKSVALSMAVAIFLILVISSIGSSYLRRRLKQPLENVVLAVNDIASGEMTDATSEALAALATRDEIGQLARSMEEAVSSVRKISDDTQYLEEAMRRSDLTVSVNTDSHRGIYKMIADVVNRLFQEIAKNMKQVQTISEGINSHTGQVAEAAQSLAQGSTEQAGSVEELAVTINSIATQVNQTAASAKDAYKASQEAETQVMSSNEQMASMMNAMEEITRTSEKIGVIVKTIDDLAFQTNLLALNAAVEAARVGAQGRGFAVVADEVQNLAGKSAAAAKDTEELIETALDAIKKGTKFAHRAEEGMKSVVGKTSKVNEMVSQITDATSEQVRMLHQVSEGVDQISVVVQTNSSIAEETAAASQGLSAQTKRLNDMVSQYKFN